MTSIAGRSKQFKDLTGQQFGRLTVMSFAGIHKTPSGQSKSYWNCQCECGNTTRVSTGNLKRKTWAIVSCGCRLREIQTTQTVHGREPRRLWFCWASMRQRCSYSKDKRFKDYGGRGIMVCDEWQNSYIAFRDWALANGWMEGLEIDRENVNGNYEPSNCRWVTRVVQQRNRRNNRLVTARGETHCVSEWAEISGSRASRIYARLKSNWPAERAIFESPHWAGQLGGAQ